MGGLIIHSAILSISQEIMLFERNVRTAQETLALKWVKKYGTAVL